MGRPERTTTLDARALSRALQRMAVEVLDLAHGTDDLVLITDLVKQIRPAALRASQFATMLKDAHAIIRKPAAC